MKNKRTIMMMLVLLLLFVVSACGNQTKEKTDGDQQTELVISAAASLTDAMKEVGDEYMKEHPNVKLRFNFGSSGTLMQQILKGSPADLYFSAAKDKFARLVAKNKIETNQSIDLLSNSLVLITPKNTDVVKDFHDLANEDIEKIALGTPETVPAGKYAKQSLQKMKLWDKVEPNVVYTKDVRQVLQYVATGNVAAGMVYKTDAAISDKVKIVAEAPEKSHDAIIYPVGIVKDTKNMNAAKDFYQYIQTDAALKVFEKYGFNAK